MLFDLVNLGNKVPLYEFYKGKTIRRLAQDSYDRFFTSIEQRVSKGEILKLKDTFKTVKVSNNLPYWHFILRR